MLGNMRDPWPQCLLRDAYQDEGFDEPQAITFIQAAIDRHISEFSSFHEAILFLGEMGLSVQEITGRLAKHRITTERGERWNVERVRWYCEQYASHCPR